MNVEVGVVYHSGAGSTRTVAKVIARLLQELGIAAKAAPVRPSEPAMELISSARLAVFGAPTYSLHPSRTFSEFANSLPPFPESKPVAVFTTYGFYPGNSLRRLASLFAEKNAVLVASLEVKAPGSDGSLFFNDTLARLFKVYEFESRAPEKLSKFVIKIADFLKHPEKLRGSAPPPTRLLDSLFSLLLKSAENSAEKYRRDFYVDLSRCTNCNFCVSFCPRGAWLPAVSRPHHVPDRCELCLGCVHNCPNEAIGFKTLEKVLERKKLSREFFSSQEERLFHNTLPHLSSLITSTTS